MTAIPITCDNCGAKYRLPETFTGAQAKCQKCGSVIDVARQRAAAEDGAEAPSAAAVPAAAARPAAGARPAVDRSKLPAPPVRPARVAAATPADRAAAAPRAGRRQPRDEPEPKASRRPLVLGGLGLLAVVVVVAVVLLLRGGGDAKAGPTAAGNPPAAQPAAPAPAVAAPTTGPRPWTTMPNPPQSMDQVADPKSYPAVVWPDTVAEPRRAEIRALVADVAAGGRAGVAAAAKLTALDHPAMFGIVEKLRQLDYKSTADSTVAFELNQLLAQITGGLDAGFVPVAAAEQLAPGKAEWNTRTVEIWLGIVARFPDAEGFKSDRAARQKAKAAR